MCIFLFLCMSETQTAVTMGYWCFSVWEDFLVLMSRSGELFFFAPATVILDWIRSWAIPFMLSAQCTHVIIIRLCTHLLWWTDVWRDWLLSRTLAVLFSVKHPWHLSSLAFSVLQVHLEPLWGGGSLCCGPTDHRVHVEQWFSNFFWLKYPFKKTNQAKYPLTTQGFVLKYSEMIGISNDNDIMISLTYPQLPLGVRVPPFENHWCRVITASGGHDKKTKKLFFFFLSLLLVFVWMAFLSLLEQVKAQLWRRPLQSPNE